MTTEANRYFRTLLLDFELVRLSETLLENAIAIKGRFGFHWYDSLIVSAALQAKCNVLYTEDLQDGQSIEGLQVVNPFR
jgi:predicted nucleic acid-binding protein